MLIIGRNPVAESLKYDPGSIKKIILLEGLSDNKIKQIITSAEKNNIKIESKKKKDFEKILDKKSKSEGISQGIIAESEDYKYANEETVIDKLKPKEVILVLILDEIQDPHNLGAIIRTSVALGADALFVTEKNSAKVNHTVVKSSAGSVSYIDIVQSKNIYKTIESLKNSGFRVLGTSLKADSSLYDVNFDGKNAVILGNEGEGVRKNLLKLCDKLIYIPIAGSIESLNVSVAAAIILYEAMRQMKV